MVLFYVLFLRGGVKYGGVAFMIKMVFLLPLTGLQTPELHANPLIHPFTHPPRELRSVTGPEKPNQGLRLLFPDGALTLMPPTANGGSELEVG